MHPLGKNILFNGKQNEFFKSEWFFTEEKRGRKIIEGALSNLPRVYLNGGSLDWAFVRQIAQNVDFNQSYILHFASSFADEQLSTEELAKILEQPLPVNGIEFENDAWWTRIDMKQLSAIKPNLTRLAFPRCDVLQETHFDKINLPA